jgi:hypothetical protein
LTANAVSGNNIGYYAVGSNNMSFTGVTAANYGGSSTVPTISVDGAGRVTYAANVSLSAIPTMDVKTTGTSATWTIPAGVTKVRVTVVGGGGAGGIDSGGGGGGGTAIKVLTVVAGTLTYTVGGAGASSQVASGTNNTITTVSATAGSAGSANGPNSGGAGGVGQNGDLNIQGQGGGSGVDIGCGNGISGQGGNSFFAGGGKWSTAGKYGGGGGGGGNSPGAGGAGIIVFEY